VENLTSFKDCSIVACGTMRPELIFLQEAGFLDAAKVLFIGPGLHDKPAELNRQLIKQLSIAKKETDKVIVLIGKRCYLDMNDLSRSIETIIAEAGDNVSRVQAGNCFDFLADEEQREQIRNGRRIYWLTPGWLLYWEQIFKSWDVGIANETFPQNEAAVLLDPLNTFEDVAINQPEKLLEFSDFMKIPIEPVTVTLDRLKELLVQELNR
jgi:uncharacterized protein DUF1638